MQHLDEGTIHAWLDGALDAKESAHIEEHVASCDMCSAAVAEARGLIAGSSRVLGALDHVPAKVIPVSPMSTAPVANASRSRGRRPFRVTPAWMAAAAAVLVVAVGIWSGTGGARKERASYSPAPAQADTSASATSRPMTDRAVTEQAPAPPAVAGSRPDASQASEKKEARTGPLSAIARPRAVPSALPSPQSNASAAPTAVAGRSRDAERVGFGRADAAPKASADSISSSRRVSDSARTAELARRLGSKRLTLSEVVVTSAPAEARQKSASAVGAIGLEGCYDVQAVMADAAVSLPSAPAAAPARTRAAAGAAAGLARAPRQLEAIAVTSSFVLDSVLDARSSTGQRVVTTPARAGTERSIVGRWEEIAPRTARVTFDDGRPALIVSVTSEGSATAKPAADTTRAGTVLRRCQ